MLLKVLDSFRSLSLSCCRSKGGHQDYYQEGREENQTRVRFSLDRLETHRISYGGKGKDVVEDYIISCFQLAFAPIRRLLRKIPFSFRLRSRYCISDDHLIRIVTRRKISAPIKCGFDRRAIQSFFR